MEKRTTLKSQVSRVVTQRPGTIRFFFLLALLAVVSAGIIVFSEPLGGNISPKRLVQDPYPVFYDVAVDSQNDLVVGSDTNRFSLRTYERTVLSQTSAACRRCCGPRGSHPERWRFRGRRC